MPRILGIDIPKDKQVETALTYIYGIGSALSQRILAEANIPTVKRARDLSDQEVNVITRIIQEKYPVEGDLRRSQAANIKRLIAIGAYRGLRHKKNLPVRGQRTRTNSRTRKGPKKTIGAIKGKEMGKPAAPAKQK